MVISGPIEVGMGVAKAVDKKSFTERLNGYLQDADYQVAASTAERRAIFRLRYKSYLREGAIHSNRDELFYDDYDEMDNCWLFGVHMDGRLVSSIRLHVISPGNPKGPSIDVFPDVVKPMIESGMTVIDPTRLVVDNAASKLYPELPYITMRVGCMASEYFDARYTLATVRSEHGAFYKRIFGFEEVCDPRPYPTLLKPISLLACEKARVREQIAERYPVFASSFTERRMLFEQPKSEMELAETVPFQRAANA